MNDLVVMLKRYRWAMFRTRLWEAVARGASVGGIAAAVVMILCTFYWPLSATLDAFSAWMIPVILLIAGGLLGCVVACLRGVSESQAARWLDRRYGLKDRLGTASELLRAGEKSSEANFVYTQAAQAGRSLPRRLDVWRCSRRTPAVLLLAVLLCAAVLLLPSRADRLADGLLSADAQQAEAMKASLAKAAKQADPETRRLLSELTRTIEVRNEAELHRILAKLRQAGFNVHEVLAANVPPSNSASSIPHSGGEAGPSASQGQVNVDKETTTDLSPSQAVTTVYHPRYTAKSTEPSPEHSPKRVPISPEVEPIQAAWQAAKVKADLADSGNSIPHRYGPILQRFANR